MKETFKRVAKGLLSQIPIFFVLLDLHLKGVEGVDRAESQRHLSRGNQLLNAGQLAEALTHYHSSIDNDEKNYQAYYMRATVYLAMGKARSALPDLNQVVKLQPTFLQARMQRANLFLKMGKLDEATADYESVLINDEDEEAAAKVDSIQPLRQNIAHAKKLIRRKDFDTAINLLNEIIDVCPWSAEFREMRADAFEGIGELRRAISDLKPTTVLKVDNTAAYLKMSSLWYKMGDLEQSLDEIRECLKLDPDHKECFAQYKSVKKLFKTLDAAKKKMAQSEWDDAITKFKKVLSQESKIVPLTIEVKLKICECYVRANNPKKGIIAASEVIALDSSNIPALLLRSEAKTQNEEYEQALDDLNKASQIDENYPGLQEKIQKAQKLLKQSKKRDYYKILGVSRSAKKKDVIKAYRKLAREWHPDNFQDENEKKNAEKKFIEIAAAKEVLSDPDKVKIFNDGYDPLDDDQVKDWEKQQTIERSSNLFEFFFKRNSNSNEEKESNRTPFEDLFRSFTGGNSKKFEDRESFERQFKNSKENLAREKRRVEEQERQKQELKRQQEELQRHQEILRQQQLEEERLRRVLIRQQEEKKRQERLRRQQEEQLRQERLRRAEEERLRRTEEERLRRAEEERQKRAEEERRLREEQERQREEQRRNSYFSENSPNRNYYDWSDRNRRNSDYGRADSFYDGYQKKPPSEKHAYDMRVDNVYERSRSEEDRFRSPTQRHPDGYRPQSSKYESFRPESDRTDFGNVYSQRRVRNSEINLRSRRDRFMNDVQDSRRLTQGRDGRWYYKDQTGRWRLHERSPPDRNHRSDSQSFRTAFDQRANTKSPERQKPDNGDYVRGTDGKLYMKVNPPRSEEQRQPREHRRPDEAGSPQQAPRRNEGFTQSPVRDLPRGLFRNDRGQISDRIGNLYERAVNGQYRVVLTAAQAKERLKQQLRSHKQADLLRAHGRQQSADPPPSKQEIFHDPTGNVYVKDQQGNLIKIKPGNRDRTTRDSNPQRSQASVEYSHRDPRMTRQQKSGYAKEQERTGGYEGQQESGGRHDSYSRYAGRQRQQREYHGYRPLHEEL